ncbi:MAG TPA: membrane protein insertase YidC [Vicinamibacterales bacterium]|nr:membrane protein insertase YidC [Vicinamibacterales bacterium]
MEKRFLLFIFLSLVILTLYQSFVVKLVPKPAPGARTATATQSSANAASPSTPAAAAPTPQSVAPPVVQPPAAPAPPEVAAVVGDTSERDVTVETPEVIAVFTNRGARLKSWRLKRYLDQEKHPQELVEKLLPNEPLPFTLRTESNEANAIVNNALFQLKREPTGVVTSPFALEFEFTSAAGLRASKTFRFNPSTYIVTVTALVTAGDQALTPAIVWGPAVGDIAEVSRYTQKAEGLVYAGDKVQRVDAKQIATQPRYDGDFKVAGVDDNYFMAAAIDLKNGSIEYRTVSVPPPAGSKDAPRDLVSFTIAPHRQDAPIQFFAGPKDFDVLEAIRPEMTNAINFGRFQVIVVPLLRSLKGVHEWVPNYGWSIVVLTIIINLIMFPLRHMSAKSMRKMAQIQPEVKAIQDRYAKFKATDPQKQKMNQELMDLYRQRGVNPAGGCVPMLLTMPIVLAMWALLQVSIELRGAPWIGWIHDLSARDPYYALPLMMGATSLWMQKMMPSTGADPAQQKMMMFMPVFMTVMLAWLPSGALIYYVVTNIWTIGQQYLTNYMIGPPPVRGPARPAAERRVKRIANSDAS